VGVHLVTGVVLWTPALLLVPWPAFLLVYGFLAHWTRKSVSSCLLGDKMKSVGRSGPPRREETQWSTGWK
jgi:uncharacterized membrane protein YphA (DoxX/SURF4 family)